MSFGFGIGDFIAVIQLANQLRKCFVDAPSEFKAISDEIKSLSNVLRDLEDLWSERDFTTTQRAVLADYTKACENVLNDLDVKVVKKYGALDTTSSKPKDKIRRIWNRSNWNSEDIKDLRSRITSNVVLLISFYTNLINKSTEDTKLGVDRLNQHQDDDQRLAILDWISLPPFAARQSDLSTSRQVGTGEWLLNSPEYNAWLNGSQTTLFYEGIPGSGKTMLTSIVVADLWHRYSSPTDVVVAGLYCDYKTQQDQRLVDVMAGFLRQILQEQTILPPSTKEIYQRHVMKKTRPSVDEILGALRGAMSNVSRVFLVLDALDEFVDSDGTRTRVLTEVLKLQSHFSSKIFIFATSRPLQEVRQIFTNGAPLEIRASDADVRKYLDGRMSRLSSCVSKRPELQEVIKAKILESIGGMFLLAKLYLDSLKDKTTPKAIKTAIGAWSSGSDALDNAYRNALDRIEAQQPGLVKLAKRVLSWTTHSVRPLTLQELQHALAVEPGESELDRENFEEPYEMVDACAGLVTIDKESNTIRLIHYTTQEYFVRFRDTWLPGALKEITTSCLTYLSFDIFAQFEDETPYQFEDAVDSPLDETPYQFEDAVDSPLDSDHVVDPLVNNEDDSGSSVHSDDNWRVKVLRDYVFVEYASLYWGIHAAAPGAVYDETLAFSFLRDKNKICHTSDKVLESMEIRSSSSPMLTGAHVATYFGLGDLLETLLDHCHEEPVDGAGWTPLVWAVEQGNEEMTKSLILRPDVDINSRDDIASTPLHRAVSRDRKVIVRLLLAQEDIDLNTQDDTGLTPLHVAVLKRNDTIVKMLTDRGKVNRNSKDKRGVAPLHISAQNGQNGVYILPVEHKRTDANIKDVRGWTPLHYAAMIGSVSICHHLLQQDNVNIDGKDNAGRTPLHHAADVRSESVVRFLSEQENVDIDGKDNEGRTPLHIAARSGSESVARFLSEQENVDIHRKDVFGQTPLHCAAEGNSESLVRLFSEREDVDLNVRDLEGKTPLHIAAFHGSGEVVRFLAEHGSMDVNARDQGGRTAFHAACLQNRLKALRILAGHDGIEINAEDGKGRTALHSVITQRWDTYALAETIRYLVGLGMDINAKDSDGWTTLHHVACQDSYTGVGSLYDDLAQLDGIDVDATNNDGETPLDLWKRRDLVSDEEF